MSLLYYNLVSLNNILHGSFRHFSTFYMAVSPHYSLNNVTKTQWFRLINKSHFKTPFQYLTFSFISWNRSLNYLLGWVKLLVSKCEIFILLFKTKKKKFRSFLSKYWLLTSIMFFLTHCFLSSPFGFFYSFPIIWIWGYLSTINYLCLSLFFFFLVGGRLKAPKKSVRRDRAGR